MIAEQTLCGKCPQSKEALELIETTFENGLCFLELECKHCASQWKAEVAMPTRDDFDFAKGRPELSTPRWCVVDIVPSEKARRARQYMEPVRSIRPTVCVVVPSEV